MIGPKRPHSQQIQSEWVAFAQNAVPKASQEAFPRDFVLVISDSENGLQREIRTCSPRDRVHQQLRWPLEWAAALNVSPNASS